LKATQNCHDIEKFYFNMADIFATSLKFFAVGCSSRFAAFRKSGWRLQISCILLTHGTNFTRMIGTIHSKWSSLVVYGEVWQWVTIFGRTKAEIVVSLLSNDWPLTNSSTSSQLVKQTRNGFSFFTGHSNGNQFYYRLVAPLAGK